MSGVGELESLTREVLSKARELCSVFVDHRRVTDYMIVIDGVVYGVAECKKDFKYVDAFARVVLARDGVKLTLFEAAKYHDGDYIIRTVAPRALHHVLVMLNALDNALEHALKEFSEGQGGGQGGQQEGQSVRGQTG